MSNSPRVREAAALLGALVATGRRRRGWTESELAERAGISRPTVRKIERGELTVQLGSAFEVASLVGVTLFDEDPARVTGELVRQREQLALLPKQVHRPARKIDDDF